MFVKCNLCGMILNVEDYFNVPNAFTLSAKPTTTLYIICEHCNHEIVAGSREGSLDECVKGEQCNACSTRFKCWTEQ